MSRMREAAFESFNKDSLMTVEEAKCKALLTSEAMRPIVLGPSAHNVSRSMRFRICTQTEEQEIVEVFRNLGDNNGYVFPKTNSRLISLNRRNFSRLKPEGKLRETISETIANHLTDEPEDRTALRAWIDDTVSIVQCAYMLQFKTDEIISAYAISSIRSGRRRVHDTAWDL
jgi:hypothetical protein